MFLKACVLLLALLDLSGVKLLVLGSTGCTMCGRSCCCPSRASGESCSVHRAGCGTGTSGDALGPTGPVRAVLVAACTTAPRFEPVAVRSIASTLHPQPTRAPLDRPPRTSR